MSFWKALLYILYKIYISIYFRISRLFLHSHRSFYSKDMIIFRTVFQFFDYWQILIKHWCNARTYFILILTPQPFISNSYKWIKIVTHNFDVSVTLHRRTTPDFLHLLSAHFKQSCSENTGAYKPVRFPAPFVITIVCCHVLFSLNMFSYLYTYTLYLYYFPVWWQ